MPKCKDCGREIGSRGKTGLCRACAKKGPRKYNMNGKCEICNKPIADWNKSGICRACQLLNYANFLKAEKNRGSVERHERGGNTNVPKQGDRVKAICCNSHCRKLFYARPDQHPKYSLCPTCKAAKEVMSRYSRMVQDTLFSNSTAD